MRTCAMWEKGGGQLVSGWPLARVRKRVGTSEAYERAFENGASSSSRRFGREDRATGTHRLHVSREGGLGYGLISLCGSAHGPRWGTITRRALTRCVCECASRAAIAVSEPSYERAHDIHRLSKLRQAIFCACRQRIGPDMESRTNNKTRFEPCLMSDVFEPCIWDG